MDDDSRMCPGCKQNTGQVMHGEVIPCPHCRDDIVIEYLSCPCRYSWREINGIFLDGGRIEVDGLEGLIQGITEFIEAYDLEDSEYTPSSMTEMIHRCLKCGSLSMKIHTNPDVYKCTACDFEWEVGQIDE